MKETKGQGLAEFALVLPLFLLLVMGIAEFGYVFIVYTSVFNAAREGARYAMADGRDTDGIYNAIEQKLLLVDLTQVEVTVSYDKGPGTEPIDVNDARLGDRVVVLVEYDVPTLTPLMRPFASSFRIDSQAARTILAVKRSTAVERGGDGVAVLERGQGLSFAQLGLN